MCMPDLYFFQNVINYLRVRELERERKNEGGKGGGFVNSFNIICMSEDKIF